MKIRSVQDLIWVIVAIVALLLIAVFKYRTYRCQNSFGVEMNARRKALKIPIIPPGWPVYHTDDRYTIWTEQKVKKGHGFKLVTYDGCELNLEEDHYWFSSKKLQDTVLTMDYLYPNSHRKIDSATFTFRQGDHEDTITRQKADSILAANKIDRDY
jgi:hypothetical protein